MLFGRVVSYWPQLEDQMVVVLGDLVSGKSGNLDEPDMNAARAVFWSMTQAKARISLMRMLLQQTPHNKHRLPIYEEILNEFERLNNIRNQIVHGFWMTAPDRTRVDFWSSMHAENRDQREPDRPDVQPSFFSGLLDEMMCLMTKIHQRHQPRA